MIAFLYNLVYFLLAAGVAYLVTPFVRKLALRGGILDVPDERRRHEKAIPTMGGVSFFLAFFSVAWIAEKSHSYWLGVTLFFEFALQPLFIGALFLLVVGVVDDRFRLNYKLKLVAQLAAALYMFYSGYQILGITNPFTGETIGLHGMSLPLTILWFLFIINAINIMDGVDGLAAGISLIALVTIFFVARHYHNDQVALLSAILAGSVAGFLRYNFYPASIFMGDTGSLLLGFLLAAISIRGAQKSSTAVALAVPVLVLGLPIMDAVVAVIRRWSSEWNASKSVGSRVFSWQRVFHADLNHIHHRFMAHGLTKRETAILLYVVAIGFGLSGFVMAAALSEAVAWMLIYMSVVFFMAFKKFPVFRETLSVMREDDKPSDSTTPSFESLLKESETKKFTVRFQHLLFWFTIVSLPLVIYIGVLLKESFF